MAYLAQIDGSDIITANTAPIRKKYRKMRMTFDEKMRESNNLVLAEALAEETAKRIAIENEFAPPLQTL